MVQALQTTLNERQELKTNKHTTDFTLLVGPLLYLFLKKILFRKTNVENTKYRYEESKIKHIWVNITKKSLFIFAYFENNML